MSEEDEVYQGMTAKMLARIYGHEMVARIAGVAPSSLSRYLCGIRAWSVDHLYRLLAKFGEDFDLIKTVQWTGAGREKLGRERKRSKVKVLVESQQRPHKFPPGSDARERLQREMSDAHAPRELARKLRALREEGGG